MSQSAKHSDHCFKPQQATAPNLSRKEYGQLIDALLYAKLNSETPAIGYQALTDDLKQHPVGQLIASALFDNNLQALDQAAQLLAPNTPNYWVALMRA
ncbi:hypothetical protein [Shewanella sp.]|uniref:hypothetical protein n=1 Tax=Shewanella sp. TaxID=50422 RepID=UPI003A97E9E8